MATRPRKIFSAFKRIVQFLMILAAGYVLFLVAAVVWAFEVKLHRWPVFVYSAPFTLQVGDDIDKVRLLTRLSRQGYVEGPIAVPEPGEWNFSGSELRIFLKHCPLKGERIASGPATLTLDWNRVRAIRVKRSLEQVDRITLEPELIQIVPGPGYSPELCRPVPLDRIPSLLIDAIVLTEDPHFFSHSGIDLRSIQQAFQTNLKARRYVQGGSTIPQQLVRMVLLSPEKTLWRKINEVLLALVADGLYSKQRILEAYLNRVYCGHWGPYPIKGAAETSRHLFGRDLMELDASECALLAASIRAPNVINPARHPERALARRNMVLGLLFKAGKISRDTYEEATNRPATMTKGGPALVKAPAFVELVKDQLPKEMRDNSWKMAVQDVITSLDALQQADVERTLRSLGESGSQAHLVLADPEAAQIRAYIAPGSEQKWSGAGGNPEVALPFIVVPALIPEAREHAKYTLASPFFVSTRSSGPITFREAFQSEKQFVVQRLVGSLGSDKVSQALREFGIRARPAGPDNIDIEPMKPVEWVQCYMQLATLGRAAVLRPSVRIVNEQTAETASLQKRISVRPAAIYMVNHLMKGPDTAGFREGAPDRTSGKPSIFTARDTAGLWGAAYRFDALLLLRLPGQTLTDAKFRKLLARLLPVPADGHERHPAVPEGVVFKNVCVESGLLSTSTCPRVIREPFFKGTQPSEWCPSRHEISTLQSATGK